MKKTLPYVLLALIAAALIALVVTGSGRKKQLDERLSFHKQDKIPYGTWVAFRALPALFPGASIHTNQKEPGLWEELSEDSSGQLFLAITPRFMAEEYEVSKLISFAESGNDVFISTRDLSYAMKKILDCSTLDISEPVFDAEEGLITAARDSMGVKLLHPPFQANRTYFFPGRNYSASFTRVNTVTTAVIGENEQGLSNFVHLRAGKGNIFVHLSPLAFSNYFLLNKDNIRYYEQVMSAIRPGIRKIGWDEYFLYKERNGNNKGKKNWISVLSKYPGLKAALLTAFFTLLLYILLEMRRKQRYIPVLRRPRNDSLDFVKTIGRLYYDRGDHRNLAQKMGTYFLEHIRSQYKLSTAVLDEGFIRNLQYKSGVPEPEIRAIVTFIKMTEETVSVSASQLSAFHQQLESFYKKA